MKGSLGGVESWQMSKKVKMQHFLDLHLELTGQSIAYMVWHLHGLHAYVAWDAWPGGREKFPVSHHTRG